MKISKLELKNCLGIKELKFVPDKINLITGGNAKGKTSILETLEKAISNKDRRIKFVNDDAEKAELIIELDNGISINRKVDSANKSTVKVSSGEFSVDRPETFLKSLLGGFGFNPIDFIMEKEEVQADMLLNVIPLKVSIDDFEGIFGELPDGIDYNQHPLKVFKQLYKRFYEARTEANREVKIVKAEIDAILHQLPENYNAEDFRNVVLSDIYKDIDEKQKVNENITKSREYIDGKGALKESITSRYKTLEADTTKSINEEINSLKLKIATLEAQRDEKAITIRNDMKIKLEEVEEKALIAEKYISSHKEFDISALKEEADQKEKMKNFVSLSDNKTRLQEELTKKESKASMLDEQVKLTETKPIEYLKAFKLPVEGLSFSDDMKLLINDRPIKNLSTAEAIKVALDIARAMAGELKLICIDKFETLDTTNKNLVLEAIKDDEFQYFITVVTDGDMKIESVKGDAEQ